MTAGSIPPITYVMRHVVITGSSSGIGLGMAVEFLKHGKAVTLNGRNERYQYPRVNNAGIEQQRKPLYDLELSEFERIINLNLTAMMKASSLKIFLRFLMEPFHKRNIIKVLEAKTGNEQ